MNKKRLIALAVKILAALVAGLLVATLFFGERIVLWVAGPPRVEMVEHYAGSGVAGSSFDHTRFDAVLKRCVDERGLVDYAALGRDRVELSFYLRALGRADFDSLPRDEKLALLINAYNAFTLELILDQQPEESIQEISREKRWEDERWNIGGRILSLQAIEHEELRARFVEPRIHFAIVCASMSCPPLRAEAYTGARIEEQLADQGRRFHADEARFRLDEKRGRVGLSRIYLWYEGDFEQVAEEVLEYAARHHEGLREAMEGGRKLAEDWLPYDWGLNRQ